MRRDPPIPGSRAPDRDAATKTTLGAVIELHSAGRFDEAMQKLAADGGGALKTATGQNIAGDILLKQGKHREALKAFDSAIKLAPTAAEPQANRGTALQAMGRLEEALAAEDRAIRLRPEYAMAHFNRGNILKALDRLDDAVAAYGRALRAQPALADGYLNRGTALLDLHRPLEALDDFGRALKLRPKYAAAHVGRAGAYRDMGAHTEALAAVEAATAIEPNNSEATRLRCVTMIAAERFPEALAAADAMVARDPNEAVARSVRAVVLCKLQRYDEALAEADVAIRLAPKHHEAHTARGIVLGEMGRLGESLEALEEAHRHGASGAEYFHGRAVALTVLGTREEAVAAFDKAIAMDPNNHVAHNNHAFLRLSLGDWEAGWAEHEWRLKARGHAHNELIRLAPQWRGEDLAGKRLFVYAEQGYGDTIQFVRYLPLLQERRAVITFAVPEPVFRLFAANFPDVDVTDMVGQRTGIDYQISLMSLPFVLGSTLATLPRQVPYLFADEERKAKWRARLGGDGFRVGIVWQGGPKYGRDRERSMRLAEFVPLAAVPGVRLISLQAAHGAGQLKTLPAGMKVEELGEEIVNNPDGFREVAAVMANLDLLILSDTGPTHLAGALGRPVWVALARHPDWRWMRDREDSPWYPTMRLFRQRTAGDWRGVFERLAAALAEEIARK